MRVITSVMYASVEGNGHKPPSEAYANAGLDIRTRSYGFPLMRVRRAVIEGSRSLEAKYAGQVSPISGRPLAQIVRTGGEALMSPCGNCGATLSRCRCDFRGPSE
jgi:hypothetical protein